MGIWGLLWGWPGPSSFGSASASLGCYLQHRRQPFYGHVTGATNGIARPLENGLKVKESLAKEVPSLKLHVMEMDLSSLDFVSSFARSFNSSHEHLNVLMPFLADKSST